MKLFSVIRVITSYLNHRSTKEIYWDCSETFSRLICLLAQWNSHFAKIVAKDQFRFVLRKIGPIPGETLERAEAAVNWLFRAQDATNDDGVSLGYFPCDNPRGNDGWRPSYPETTGYIIASLLEYAKRMDSKEAQDRAMRMAVWESKIQMPSGAVQGGPTCPPAEQTAAAFNTGMVLQGYTAILEFKRDETILAAARRAADFLVSDLDGDGYFCTNGEFVTPEDIKTYNCLCAWALYRFGNLVDEARYRDAALLSIEAAIRQQRPNGWFANNCLTWADAPLLHTIGYTLQGILEVGALAEREDFISVVRAGTDPLLSRMSPDGYLHGRYHADWEPACFGACLTGNAQLAVVCYRLYQITGEREYQRAGNKLTDYLKPLQLLDSPDPAANGALAGSFPMLGYYMSTGYPNWATKYFLDALLLQDELSHT